MPRKKNPNKNPRTRQQRHNRRAELYICPVCHEEIENGECDCVPDGEQEILPSWDETIE